MVYHNAPGKGSKTQYTYPAYIRHDVDMMQIWLKTHDDLDVSIVHIEARLVNLNNTTFNSGTFVLPTKLPRRELSSYHAVCDHLHKSYNFTEQALCISNIHQEAEAQPEADVFPHLETELIRSTINLAEDLPRLSPLPVLTKPEASSDLPLALEEPNQLPTIPTNHQSKSGNDPAADCKEDPNNSYFRSSSGVDWAVLDEEDESQEFGVRDRAVGPLIANMDAESSDDSLLMSPSTDKMCSGPSTPASIDCEEALMVCDTEDEEHSFAMDALNLEGLQGKPVQFARCAREWEFDGPPTTCIESLSLEMTGGNACTWNQYLFNSSVGINDEQFTAFDLDNLEANSDEDDETETEHDEQQPREDEIEIPAGKPSSTPNLRQYVPDDTTAEYQAAMVDFQTEFAPFSQKLKDSMKRVLEDGYDVKHAQGNVDWWHMYQASQRLVASGQLRRRVLEEMDRSLDWFWTVEKADGTKAIVHRGFREATPAVPEWPQPSYPDSERPVHHLNFAGQPVYCKSATPPAVSLWAALSPALEMRKDYNKSLFRTVVSSEAGRYLDPFYYSGPVVIPDLSGTALRDLVTGQVEKVYHDCGYWNQEQLDYDDDRPLSWSDVPFYFQAGTEGLNDPPAVCHAGFYSDEVPVVNDDGRVHVCRDHKRNSVGLPSKLRMVEDVDDSVDEVEQAQPAAGLEEEDLADLVPCPEMQIDSAILEIAEIVVDEWINDFGAGKKANSTGHEHVSNQDLAAFSIVLGNEIEIKPEADTTAEQRVPEKSGKNGEKEDEENDHGAESLAPNDNEQSPDPEDSSSHDEITTDTSIPSGGNSLAFQLLFGFGLGVAVAEYGLVRCLLYGSAVAYLGNQVYHAFRR